MEKDTFTQEAEAANQRIIEEMMAAQKAPEPGSADSAIIHKGDAEIPMPLMKTYLTSAGYSYIWDSKTGERSLTNNNMLPTQLKKLRLDKTRVFTVFDPHITPKRGVFKCMLHPEAPNREYYEGLGFTACPKSNLTSKFQVNRHMQKRHPMEWATVEEERKTAELTADRAHGQKMLETMVEAVKGNRGDTPEPQKEKPEVYVSDKDKKKKS